MNLVFIYGPAATGKKTVADALAEQTGIENFHNHVTVDAALQEFEFGTHEFFAKTTQLRYERFKQAVLRKESIIFTFCYVLCVPDMEFVQTSAELFTYNEGRFCPVQLIADRKTLLQRVQEPSRKAFGKLQSTDGLEDAWGREDHFSQIPGSLTIDNTNLPPEEAARQIAEHYELI